MSAPLPPDKLAKLESEYGILHLIYCRSKNQHRVAVWWRYFSLVHRKVRTILVKFQTMEITKLLKKRELLRQEAIDTAAYLFKKKVLKKALYEFHGIIALGQFINLGILLVGNVSSIYNILLEMDEVSDKLSLVGPTNLVKSVEEDDDDMGVEVEMPPMKKIFESETTVRVTEATSKLGSISNTDLDSEPIMAPPVKEKKEENAFDIDSLFGDDRKKHKKALKGKKEKKDRKEKKAKKKKNAMDDIFG
ncbi:CIC11C00000005272 [Sungouiella intermedia]|uniref:CIC11C00000005272 n=1 Tax=Sungouiella intermedia TaxID=45354 RepID=A0A1L0DGG0_9ASCO|nr:CIC11C00000005272 [[Candida] intermedia]